MANISAIKVGSTSYGLTPASHASTATTYGAATASNYGHVKLSDNYTSSAGAAASGIGASSKAVSDCYNELITYIDFDTEHNIPIYIWRDEARHRAKVKRFQTPLKGTNDITINTGINAANVYDIRAIAYNTTTKTCMPLPNVGHSTVDPSGHAGYDIAFYMTNNVIHIKPYSDRSGYAALVTVYYI